MDEAAEPEEQQRMITGSSIKRKPFFNLTNLIPKPYHHSSSFSRSTKPKSAASAADSSISGSTDGSDQNPNPVKHPNTVPRDQNAPRSTLRTPSPACSRRQTMLKTRRKTKAATAPVYPTSLEKTKNDKKARPGPLRCSTLKNIKVKEKGIALRIDLPSLDNDRKEVSTALHCSSAEKIKDKGKAIAVPLMKKATNNMEDVHMPLSGVKMHGKGKAVDGAEDALQSKSLAYPRQNNRKRRCTSKGSSQEDVLPQDFINQQRAYFKEIDDYELEVEEVSL